MLNSTTGFRIPLGFSRKRPWFSNPCRTHCWPQFFFKEAAEDGAAIMTPLGMLLVFSHGFSWVFGRFSMDFPWPCWWNVSWEISLGKQWRILISPAKMGCFRQPRKWGYNQLQPPTQRQSFVRAYGFPRGRCVQEVAFLCDQPLMAIGNLRKFR